jgi:hypothetical protein
MTKAAGAVTDGWPMSRIIPAFTAILYSDERTSVKMKIIMEIQRRAKELSSDFGGISV